MTKYANFQQNQWKKLVYYWEINLKCNEWAVIVKNFIEKDRVYDFLAGLNSEIDQIRVQILDKEEVPSFNEEISLIRVEESQTGVMLEP